MRDDVSGKFTAAQFQPGNAGNPYGRGGRLGAKARKHVNKAVDRLIGIIEDPSSTDDATARAAELLINLARGRL